MSLFKRKPYRNPKLLKAAKGEPCLFRGPTCNGDASTVVACHSNLGEDGKGMRQKADDDCSFYGCSNCHAFTMEGTHTPSILTSHNRQTKQPCLVTTAGQKSRPWQIEPLSEQCADGASRGCDLQKN